MRFIDILSVIWCWRCGFNGAHMLGQCVGCTRRREYTRSLSARLSKRRVQTAILIWLSASHDVIGPVHLLAELHYIA
jgi:hypothetical protein